MISVHDPDVVLTDLGLAGLGAYFAWRLWRTRGALLMLGLASAAFWGAVFHAFFPAKTATTGGYIAWLLVAFSIIVVSGALLNIAVALLFPRLGARDRKALVFTYCLGFAAMVLLVDESFTTVVRLYAPTLLVALIAAITARWTLVAAGLLMSALAAVLQQAEVAIHPVYFDHNAVYHVLQAAALVLLYLEFHGRRADQAVRA